MNCGVILTTTNGKNIVDSMVSILENTIKPKAICILANKNTDKKQLEISKSFLKSCCDNNSYSEEFTKDGVIIKNENSNGAVILFIFDNKSPTELKNMALEYIYDSIDCIFTITSGTIYFNNFIEEMSAKLKIENTGCVYSDYIINNKIKHLSYFHPMLNHQVEVKEIGFNKTENSNSIFKTDEFQLLSDFYNRSIVRHIAEPLFII